MWLLRLRKLAKTAGREALILFLAARHPDTPLPLKLAAAAALAYLVSPVDLLPDLPLIGWVDDLVLVSVGMPYLIRRLPSSVREQAGEQADRVLALLGIRPPAQGDASAARAAAAPPPRRRAATPRKRAAPRGEAVSDAKIVSEPAAAAKASRRR